MPTEPQTDIHLQPASVPEAAVVKHGQGRLFWLDIWRLLAVTLVFCTHYKPWAGRWHALADEGHTGVALFFVLSGTVLGLQLWQEVEKRLDSPLKTSLNAPVISPAWWRSFYIRRLAKLFTLHTLLYVMQLPFLFATGYVLLNLALVKGLYAPALFSGLPQAWTLTPELLLYLSLPLWFWAYRQRPWLPLALSAGIAISISFIDGYAATYTALGRGFAFVLGLHLARLLIAQEAGKKVVQAGRVRGMLPWAVSVAGVVLLLLALGQLADFYAPAELARPASTDTRHWAALLANAVVVPLVFGAGIWITRAGFLGNVGTPIHAVQQFISLLARASYAFYLLHVGPVAQVVYLLAFHNNLLAFAALWGLAVAVHLLVESPLLQIIQANGRIR